MLARLERTLPHGDYLYEPKWDGFRCIAFCERGNVDLRSRHDRPLGRYFPELTAPMASMAGNGIVLDGEIVLIGPTGFDFAALMLRLHPARSRVVDDHRVRLTHLDRILWPEVAMSKREYLRYLCGISVVLLPHLRGPLNERIAAPRSERGP
jgi:hypothetical protein